MQDVLKAAFERDAQKCRNSNTGEQAKNEQPVKTTGWRRCGRTARASRQEAEQSELQCALPNRSEVNGFRTRHLSEVADVHHEHVTGSD